MMAERLTADDLTRDLLSRLDGVQQKNGYWMALCPAHDDHNPSLTVRQHADGPSVKCHASHETGCTTSAILDALDLTVKDIRVAATLNGRNAKAAKVVENDKPEAPALYYYQDAEGRTLFRVRRYYARGKKKFIQETPPADGGEKWQVGLNGVEPVLYRLPELASRAGRPVYVVEGEKDADRLAALGLLATTSPMGAGKWRPEYAAQLGDGPVYVLPDNDEPGRAHATKIVESRPDAVVVELPELGPKEDVSDWLDRGGTPERLADLAAAAGEGDGPQPLPEFQTFTLAELMAETFDPVRFIVEDLIPEGTAMLGGKPKMGKSWLTLGLCISIATGTRALKHYEVDQGDALYLALEDNKRRLYDRAGKILSNLPPGLDLSYLHMQTYVGRLDEGLIEAIKYWAETTARRPRIVVLDTIARIRSRNATDRRQLYDQDYEVGELLSELAAEYKIALIPVGHLKKGDADDPLDLISGSTGLTGGMDGAMVLNRTRSAADAVLKGVHRELQDDPDIALKWNADEGMWEYAGEAEEYMLSKERKEILDFLANAPGPMRPKDIAEGIDKLTPSVTRLLGKMREDGMVDSPGYGKYELASHQAAPPKEATLTNKKGLGWVEP